MSQLLAKFFFISLNQISITLQPQICSLYFFTNLLQWTSSFSTFPILFKSFTSYISSLWKLYSSFFSDRLSNALSLEAFLSRDFLKELLGFCSEPLELALSIFFSPFYVDFFDVTDSFSVFLSFECLSFEPRFRFSLEYFGFKTFQGYVQPFLSVFSGLGLFQIEILCLLVYT